MEGGKTVVGIYSMKEKKIVLTLGPFGKTWNM